MPFAVNEITDLLVKLAEEEQLRLSVTEATKGAVIAGVFTFGGALLGGPIGMAVGGAAGAAIGAATSKNFKPLAIVIRELPTHKKNELAGKVNAVITSFEPGDVVSLIALVQGSVVLRPKILETMGTFFNAHAGQSLKL